MLRTVEVTISGISPLLMHAYPMMPIEALEKKPPEEQAELAAYRIASVGSELYLPGTAVQRALIAGATYSRGKGRASLQKPVAACVQIVPDQIGLGTADYKLDARSVVIPATKGRVMRYRPRLDEWAATFTADFDDALISLTEFRQVVDDTGKRVGLLEFRPEKKGSFGRFVVDKWSLK